MHYNARDLYATVASITLGGLAAKNASEAVGLMSSTYIDPTAETNTLSQPPEVPEQS